MSSTKAVAGLRGVALRLDEDFRKLDRAAEKLDEADPLRVQAMAVVEEYDLLRHLLREAALNAVIFSAKEQAA